MSEEAQLEEQPIAGVLFEGEESAVFAPILNKVSAPQILMAGQFLVEYARYLMQKNWVNQEMKKARTNIAIPNRKLQ